MNIIINWIINNKIISKYKFPLLFKNSRLYHFPFMEDIYLYLILLTERNPKRILLLRKHEGEERSVSKKWYTVKNTKLKENILNLGKMWSKSIPTSPPLTHTRGICSRQPRDSRFGLHAFNLVLAAVWRHLLADVFSVQNEERILGPANSQEIGSSKNPQPG